MKKDYDATYGISKSLETTIREEIAQGLQTTAIETKAAATMEDLVNDAPLEYEKPLSHVQFATAIAVAHGMPYTAIAAEFQITPQTISRWMRDIPQFKEKVRQIQVSQGISSLSKRFESIADRAIDIMNDIMEDTSVNASTRLQAAVNFVEQVRGKPKQAIEQKGGNLLQTLLSRLDAQTEEDAIARFIKKEEEERKELPDAPSNDDKDLS